MLARHASKDTNAKRALEEQIRLGRELVEKHGMESDSDSDNDGADVGTENALNPQLLLEVCGNTSSGTVAADRAAWGASSSSNSATLNNSYVGWRRIAMFYSKMLDKVLSSKWQMSGSKFFGVVIMLYYLRVMSCLLHGISHF